ncbi:MAG: beta-propeller domain-containing protein [Deltaproteobacteria bacterium]|nr:beta-propeller domain-containing protein [Deltaproteobacteria bacterium]
MAEDSAGAATPPTASAQPHDYTQTNTQVAGVDEADFVKNDATRIFVLSGGTLYVNQSWPADQLATVGKVAIEGWPREMFLDEANRVVVFSQVYRPYEWADTAWACRAGLGDYSCSHDYANTLKMTVLDVADSAHPSVTREEYLPGTYVSSRRIGASVRVVLSDPFRWPAGVSFYPEDFESVYRDKALRASSYDELMDQNETLIRAQPLEHWLPAGERRLSDGSVVEVPYDCRDFRRPSGATELGLVTVATLLLDDPSAPVARTSIVAAADEIYASASSLYLANQHWWWWPEDGQQNWTYVHKLDISQPDRALYVASGAVEGHIVDQFSMDEHQGYLRIASTLGRRVRDTDDLFGRFETTNRVAVLAEREGRLELIGKTDELANGERLYSSRFLGERGFMVTFRQIDPLFTLDLSDPSNPRQVGELKVPGFSTYLHPLENGRLLAIGTSQDRSVQLSIFDVSDLANPTQEHTLQLGTYGGSSEAQYEHKAFNHFPAKKLLAIPFFDWSAQAYGADYWTGFVSELRVFTIDPQLGIVPRGSLPMAELYSRGGSGWNQWGWYWNPGVRRSVMADDFVYAISDAGIRSANVAALASPLKTVLFDSPSGL